MKKIIVFFAVTVLLLSLVGCTKVGTGAVTKEQSSRTLDNTQKSEDNGPEKPQETDTAAENEHEPYEIEIYSFRTGTSTYVLGVALADLINQNSSWLKATALAAENQNATASLLISSKAKTAIGYCVLPVLINGYEPFKEPNTDLRSIATFACAANGFVTLDPNIKTMKDFEGKRIMLGPVGGYPRRNLPETMIEYMGINCKISYGDFADSVDALINGQVDVIFGGGNALKPDFSKWSCHPSYTELVARFDVCYVDVDPEALAYAEDKWNFHLDPPTITVPAYQYDEKWDKPVTIMADYTCWCCNKDFPDDVVKEILRIMADNSSKFVDYLPAGEFITPETMAKVDMPEYIHLAAKEFYMERGLWDED